MIIIYINTHANLNQDNFLDYLDQIEEFSLDFFQEIFPEIFLLPGKVSQIYSPVLSGSCFEWQAIL